MPKYTDFFSSKEVADIIEGKYKKAPEGQELSQDDKIYNKAVYDIIKSLLG